MKLDFRRENPPLPHIIKSHVQEVNLVTKIGGPLWTVTDHCKTQQYWPPNVDDRSSLTSDPYYHLQ